MKRLFWAFAILLGGATLALAADSKADFIFPGQPGYTIGEQSRLYRKQEVQSPLPESAKTEAVIREGYLTETRYGAAKDGQAAPAAIVDHYEQALKSAGGEVYLRKDTTLQGAFQKDGRQCYLALEVYNGGMSYRAKVLEERDPDYQVTARGADFSDLPNYASNQKYKYFERLKIRMAQADGGKPEEVAREGYLSYTAYGYNRKGDYASSLQICRDFGHALKALGGEVLWESDSGGNAELHASFELNGVKHYLAVRGYNGGVNYTLQVLEEVPLRYDVTVLN